MKRLLLLLLLVPSTAFAASLDVRIDQIQSAYQALSDLKAQFTSNTYVKTLGQVEFLMTLAIAVFYFHEKPTRLELAGMLLIVSGGVALLLN